jgi:hypothetical protein
MKIVKVVINKEKVIIRHLNKNIGRINFLMSINGSIDNEDIFVFIEGEELTRRS